MANESYYKVIFQNQSEIYEIYARQIFQSDMWGFIEVEEFVFGERSQIVVDPSEEKLKNEFKEVKRSYIPMHSVIRIDEVEKQGVGKISESTGSDSKITSLPFPGVSPSIKGSDD